jgi:Flp pilus assembly protein TadG
MTARALSLIVNIRTWGSGGCGGERDGAVDRPTGNHRESGVAIVAMSIWIFALLAITAIAVEVARLTTTATEVQLAADSAALAGALAISQGQSGQAVSQGQTAAGANSADGRPVDAAHGATVQIDVGNYDPDPAANPHFTTSCIPDIDCTAARATVTLNDVNFVMASVLSGQAGTSVQKTAVAGVRCQGGASPLPLALCSSALTEIPQSSLCGDLSSYINIKPDEAQNGCWTSLGSNSSSAAFVESIFPSQCGGAPIYTSLGQEIDLHGGLSDAVFAALQCCIQCQDLHDFTVPVINCTGDCTGYQAVIGFATLHIENATDVSRNKWQVTNCNPFSYCPQGVQVTNVGISQINGQQVCKSDLTGGPGGTGCQNFGNTIAPVMGQLP